MSATRIEVTPPEHYGINPHAIEPITRSVASMGDRQTLRIGPLIDGATPAQVATYFHAAIETLPASDLAALSQLTSLRRDFKEACFLDNPDIKTLKGYLLAAHQHRVISWEMDLRDIRHTPDDLDLVARAEINRGLVVASRQALLEIDQENPGTEVHHFLTVARTSYSSQHPDEPRTSQWSHALETF